MARPNTYTKEVVIEKAVEILHEEGMNAIVARNLAKRLGCTTAPIFTCFNNMDDLKEEVFLYTKNAFIEYVKDAINYEPALKEYGLRIIKYSMENPFEYCLLFENGTKYSKRMSLSDIEFDNMINPFGQKAANSFGLEKEDLERLMGELLIYSNGIAHYLFHNKDALTLEQISQLISDVCIGIVNNCHIRSGNFNLERAKMMTSLDVLKKFPERRG